MDESSDVGKLPGWTLLVGLLGWLIAPMILETCRDFGLPWKVGVPVASVCLVVGVFAESALERKYLPSRQREARTTNWLARSLVRGTIALVVILSIFCLVIDAWWKR